MDWARAKSILIIVFLILNIFLIVNLGITNLGSGTSREAILNTVKILKNKGITLTCEVPVNSSEIYKLKYENNSIDRAKIADLLLGDKNISEGFTKESIELSSGSKTLKFKDFNSFSFKDIKPVDKINISNKSEVEKSSKKLLQSLNINFYQYYTDTYKANLDGTVSIVLRDRYKKSIFFDNYAVFVVSNDGIKSLDCKFRIIGGVSNTKTSVSPAYEILLKNFNDKKNMKIVSIDLGWYIGDKDEAQTKEAYVYPVWRILTENGDSYYYSASSGDKIN
jgi:regulatory protein YycI of two-component signal transduction system YycFG